MSVSSPWSPFSFKNVPDPLSNIDPKYVNVTNSDDPRGFGSNETNRQWGLSGISNNAQAAAASAIKGGARSKTLRRKIKNIVEQVVATQGKSTEGVWRQFRAHAINIASRFESKKIISRISSIA